MARVEKDDRPVEAKNQDASRGLSAFVTGEGMKAGVSCAMTLSLLDIGWQRGAHRRRAGAGASCASAIDCRAQEALSKRLTTGSLANGSYPLRSVEDAEQWGVYINCSSELSGETLFGEKR